MPDRDTAKENLHHGHRERLRQRFIHQGLEGFDDHQVLELLLFFVLPRGDTNPIAHRLIERFGSLSAALEADPKDLASVDGMGKTAATFVAMIPPLTRRYFHNRIAQNPLPLTSAEAAQKYLVPLMAGRKDEVFYVLCLDNQCRVLYPCLIGEGTVTSAYVHPRHVVEAALRHNAAHVLLAHNHPSGKLTPSSADHRLTVTLVQALGALDIQVVDHCIVGGDQIFSFAKVGVLPAYSPLV